ncbi:MAG: hypothetical protein KatS3mg085_533 [Candidatus Dojkabacteria bacterium]|nr:MAG: hypothetical protein KatS3mg085_533 [Candidatus Dojkabacteria bacterium]
MRILVSAPHLTKPTLETIESISKKRFKSIDRLLNHMKDKSGNYLEISVDKEGDEFKVVAKLNAFSFFVVTTKHRDLRIAIRDASKELKAVVKKAKNN